MAVQYQDKFPVAFSEDGPKHHLYLNAKDYKKICNTADHHVEDADPERLEKVIEGLRAIRVAQNTTGGEIRVYGRSLNTGQALLKTIHPKIRKDNFVEVIGLSSPKQNWKNYLWPRVVISNNGVINPDDRKLMFSDLDKKVMVIMSGGEGRSDDPFYKPVAKLIRKLIDDEIYLWAVCMSYQVMADQVLHLGIKKGQALPGPLTGRFHIGTQIADLTDDGKQDPVFSHLAPAFAVESFNHFRIYGSELASDVPAKNVKVVARDRASKEIVAYRVGEACWAIQYHPELKKMSLRGRGIQNKKSLSVKGKSIIVPKGVHSYQATLMSRLVHNKEIFEKYHITPEDLQQFFHPARRVQNVGDELTLSILEQAVEAKKRELGL